LSGPTQLIFGLGICGLFAAIAGWVAFGNVSGSFSTDDHFAIPDAARNRQRMDRARGICFGAIAVGAFGVAMAIRSLMKWRR
jgi:hypothetical protein